MGNTLVIVMVDHVDAVAEQCGLMWVNWEKEQSVSHER